MAKVKIQGMTLAIATAFAATKAISAITNAGPGVATFEASHGVIEGDVVEILTSGWPRLANRVVRAGTVSTNDIELEGVTTTDTDLYPAGEGAGTAREISTWTAITQLRPDFSVSGGGTRKSEVTEVTDVRAINLPILIEAVALEFNGNWDPTLPWWSAVQAASDSSAQTPFRWTLPGGLTIYGNGYWSFNDEPNNEGGVATYRLSLDLTAKSITYTD